MEERIRKIIAVFMIVMSLGMITIWSMDLAKGNFSENFFSWREGDNVMYPHILIEFVTAAILIISGIGQLLKKDFSDIISTFALGMLFYTSVNSLSWSLAESERFTYSIPMLGGAIGSLFSLILLQINENKNQ